MKISFIGRTNGRRLNPYTRGLKKDYPCSGFAKKQVLI